MIGERRGRATWLDLGGALALICGFYRWRDMGPDSDSRPSFTPSLAHPDHLFHSQQCNTISLDAPGAPKRRMQQK